MKSLYTGVKEFFWPGDPAVRLRRLELTFWAFVLALAYLPIYLGFLAWIALVRPLDIISRQSGKNVFKTAYFYSFMANLFHLYWVAVVTPPGMVAAIFILSLYPAIVLTAFVRLYNFKKWFGLAMLPFLWVGMEYFRSLTEFSFPWTDLSYSQGYYLTFMQIVSAIGCYGLSLILVWLNILAWQAWDRRNVPELRIKAGSILLALVVGVYLYGWVVFPPYPIPGKINVGLLQGNVDLESKWDEASRNWNLDLYDSLSQDAVKDSGVDLLIWPETAAPCYPRVEKKYRAILSDIAAKSKTNHLVGALDIVYSPHNTKTYNSAFQFDSAGEMQEIYHKNKLVPFSEHVPYQDNLKFLTRDFLEKYLDIIKTQEVQWWSDFYPGDSIVIFNLNENKYAVLICYESAFPDYVRKTIMDGAEFLVNITNDTWFGRSSGPFQHLRLAVFRAVENRIWLARCANSGISAFIDPYGREFESTGLYERKVVRAGIYPLDEYTIFTRIGPIAGKISAWLLAFTLVILTGLWTSKKLRRR